MVLCCRTSEPSVVFYSGRVIGQSAVQYLDEIGPEIQHSYEVSSKFHSIFSCIEFSAVVPLAIIVSNVLKVRLKHLSSKHIVTCDSGMHLVMWHTVMHLFMWQWHAPCHVTVACTLSCDTLSCTCSCDSGMHLVMWQWHAPCHVTHCHAPVHVTVACTLSCDSGMHLVMWQWHAPCHVTHCRAPCHVTYWDIH